MTVKIIPTEESDVIPSTDPYHADTGGMTYTVIKLDGEERKIYVMQENKTNSTNIDEWNNLTWVFPLDENTVDSYYHKPNILDGYLNSDGGQALLDKIFDAYSSDYNQQSNLVGSWDDKLIDELAIELESLEKQELEIWSPEEWLNDWDSSEINCNTTDEEIQKIVNRLEPDGKIRMNGDIRDYLLELRDDKITDKYY